MNQVEACILRKKYTILNINANIIIRSLLTFVSPKTQNINSSLLQFVV